MAPLREVSLIGRLLVALAVVTSLVVAREVRDDADAPESGWSADDRSTELAVDDFLPIAVDESEVPTPAPTEPTTTTTTAIAPTTEPSPSPTPAPNPAPTPNPNPGVDTGASDGSPTSTTAPDELAMAAPTSTTSSQATPSSTGVGAEPGVSTTAPETSAESDPATGAAAGDVGTSTPRATDDDAGNGAAGSDGDPPSTAATSNSTPSTTTRTESAEPATVESSTPGPTVTQPTATQPPTTRPSTTRPPTTQAPTTQAPTTQAPTTQAPTTQAPTTQAPTTQAPTTQPQQGAGGLDYGSNLSMIRQASVRNRNHDASPYRNTASASLNPSDHYGPRSDYLGNPAGNPEQSFPVAAGGQFRTACEFSHFSYDDPLVYPGKPGAAHLHMYFGNTDVNAFSTANSLLNSGSSTCNGQELNRTGYWVPAMFDGRGNVRVPERIVVYYKGEGLAQGASEPYPAGAAMVINDNINAISVGQGGAQGKFSFVCSDNYSGNGGDASNTIPDCDGNRFKNLYGVDDDPRVVLEMNVKFPQCWNGRDPGNPDNFRYPTSGSWYYSLCEGGFNHTLPNLEYFVNYHVEVGERTDDWYLASDVQYTEFGTSKADGGSTVHGDWWGAWHQGTNQLWIDNCVNHRSSSASGCGFGYLTDGGSDSSNPAGGPALKYRPQYTGPNKVAAGTLFEELCPNPDRQFGRAEDAAYCRPSSR